VECQQTQDPGRTLPTFAHANIRTNENKQNRNSMSPGPSHHIAGFKAKNPFPHILTSRKLQSEEAEEIHRRPAPHAHLQEFILLTTSQFKKSPFRTLYFLTKINFLILMSDDAQDGGNSSKFDWTGTSWSRRIKKKTRHGIQSTAGNVFIIHNSFPPYKLLDSWKIMGKGALRKWSRMQMPSVLFF